MLEACEGCYVFFCCWIANLLLGWVNSFVGWFAGWDWGMGIGTGKTNRMFD